MQEYIFGANILENLTTGMYQDSKIIYREYIQNSCDQIDKAVRDGILNSGDGKIEIWLDCNNRTISIEDNATGINASEFVKTLGDIADSDKEIGKDKGFRGIGRLCGLAYCRELIFTSTAKGEDIISVLYCDAEKMRKLIEEHGCGKKHTANEVLKAINRFETRHTDDVDVHFFKVELIGINDENKDLLDSQQIKDYLSFVAPVPYQNTFIYRTEIYKHAEELNTKIDEYSIKLHGEQIFKKYKTNFKTSKGEDEIFDIEFKEIKDKNNNLLAWIWIGVSRFKAIISKEVKMRGLRLRKENIQIGNDDTLQKLFREDRGHHYFIGEVFAVAKELIPNSQRDYFNENTTRADFERELKCFFNEELTKIYYDGSAINSAFNKIDTYERKKAYFKEKETKGEFVDTQQKQVELAEIEKAKTEAEKAKTEIEKKKLKANTDVDIVGRIIERIESKHTTTLVDIDKLVEQATPIEETKPTWRIDKLTQYNRNERKLISKIYSIIFTATDRDTAEMIIKKIESELQ
jgi:molecular chaperone HtpG